jgi:hypothetical protein
MTPRTRPPEVPNGDPLYELASATTLSSVDESEPSLDAGKVEEAGVNAATSRVPAEKGSALMGVFVLILMAAAPLAIACSLQVSIAGAVSAQDVAWNWIMLLVLATPATAGITTVWPLFNPFRCSAWVST